MEITHRDIVKFQKLYKEKFGQPIGYDEARDKLALLVRQIEIIYKPITVKQLEALRYKKTRT